MARKVFFSFHYALDVKRVVQVRNSWVVRRKGEAQPFHDKAQFEKSKQRAGGIERWIEEQLKGTSVTVVLFGAETYSRKWVIHEIKRSYAMKKGILAIDIHKIKAPQSMQGKKGKNPLDCVSIDMEGKTVKLSSIYKTYDWEDDKGYDNIESWIEDAARAAGR